MGQSMGTLDFFLLEGGEYLERLDALAQAPAGAMTQGDELLRLTRAFRGSAIMASQHGMARAAQGLESCARAVRENRLGWSEATRGELIRAVDDCKILMRRLRTPDQGDTEKAEAIGIALDRLSGRVSAAMRASVGPGLDAGGRAFVAREAASIASVLQNVAHTLRADPSNRDVLVSISPAMSALRGVAILNDLPPLGDILSAIEHGSKDVMAAAGTMGGDAANVFEAGARALARAAREVVDTGRPDADAEESRAFSGQLFTALAGGGVVSIESLFYADAGPHIVQQGTAPHASGAGLARVEMVSHGEYLTAAAAELGRAETPVQRDLRLYGIAASVRPMMGAAGSPLSSALGRFAEAARDAIGRGAASDSVSEFVVQVQYAADTLASAQSGDEQALSDRLSKAAGVLTSLKTARRRSSAPEAQRAAASAAAAAAHPAHPAPMAPAAPPSPPQPTLPAPSSPIPAWRSSAPAPGAAPAAALGEADLASSFLTLEELITDRGMPPGSLAELVAGGTSMSGRAPRVPAAPVPPEPEAVRISQRMTPPRRVDLMSEAPIVPVESLVAAPADADVVAIESLVYRGDSALRRALELRSELVALKSNPADPRIAALLHEVLDLVELGLTAGR